MGNSHPKDDPFAAKLYETFTEAYCNHGGNADLPDDWNRDFFEDEERRAATIAGLAEWVHVAQETLPANLGLRLEIVLRAMLKGEEQWLKPIASKRKRAATKDDYDLLFCCEIEFLRGKYGKLNRAFFEATGQLLPTRSSAINPERSETYTPLQFGSYQAYEKALAKVKSDSVRVKLLQRYRSAGESVRQNVTFSDEAQKIIRRRQANIDTWGAVLPRRAFDATKLT